MNLVKLVRQTSVGDLREKLYSDDGWTGTCHPQQYRQQWYRPFCTDT